MIAALMLLMIVPENFDYSSLLNAEAPAAGGFISRLLWLGLLAGGIIIVASSGAVGGRVLRELNLFLPIFVLIAAASVLWSIEPVVTMRRLIRLLTIVLCSLAFVVAAWSRLRFQNVVRPVFTLMLLGSVVFGLMRPDLAIHDQSSGVLIGAWRGLTNHKNGLGTIASIGLLLWFHAWLSAEAPTWRALPGMALAITCLYLSRSSTSMVVAAFTLLLLIMLMRSPKALSRYMPFLVILFISALLAYSLALLQILPGLYTLLSPIGAITGKDMTFTGRTDIWEIMSEHISQQPYLGTGYGAYWTGIAQGAASFDFILRLDFYPGSAHNGYLEILNDLGAIGLIVLLGYLAVFVAQSLRLLHSDRNQGSLYLALFMQQAITNLAESRWLSVLSIDFVIMTLATTALARGLLENTRTQGIGHATLNTVAIAPVNRLRTEQVDDVVR